MEILTILVFQETLEQVESMLDTMQIFQQVQGTTIMSMQDQIIMHLEQEMLAIPDKYPIHQITMQILQVHRIHMEHLTFNLTETPQLVTIMLNQQQQETQIHQITQMRVQDLVVQLLFLHY